MFEQELTRWWAGLSDDQRQKLKASAESGVLDDETRNLLTAMTDKAIMAGVMALGDGTGHQVQRWNPIVRDFVLAQ